MELEKIKPGMLVWSQAGHDKGKLYMVLRVEEEYLFLADGKSKTKENPKKKKKKHVQWIRQIPQALKTVEPGNIKNEEIKYAIKSYLKKEL